MHFSKGQIAFAIFFIVVFIAGMIWAYRKDYEKNKKYFKGTSLVIITIIIVYALFWLFIRKFN
jgi:hypothetical membrane protein